MHGQGRAVCDQLQLIREEKRNTNANKVLDNVRYVIVGDVHGSDVGLKEVLFAANVTTSPVGDCVWREDTININMDMDMDMDGGNGKGTIVIQVGDMVDRGPGALEAWKCLEDLDIQAGGEIESEGM